MRRVLVIGCPGAGKSTLTRALAETLGLPAVYLDRLWWKSGWINRTRAEFDARLDAALRGRLVMDGNYLRTLPRVWSGATRCSFWIPQAALPVPGLRRILRWRGRTAPTWPRAARSGWTRRSSAGSGTSTAPSAPGAGASGRLEGRGAYLPQPRPVRRFSCTAENQNTPGME